MAVEQPCFDIGFLEAAADLSAKQYYAVYASAAGKVTVVATAGTAMLGILQNKPKSGEVAHVRVIGVSKLVTGAGDLAAAAQWESAAGGTGITAEAGKVAGGTVLYAAAAGELATVTVGCGIPAVIHA